MPKLIIWVLSVCMTFLLGISLVASPFIEGGGDAEVTRTRNLQYFEREPGDADVTRLRNLKYFQMEPGDADVIRDRNLQSFELRPLLDFGISVSPLIRAVDPPQSTTYGIRVISIGNFGFDVSLTGTTHPDTDEISLKFDPETVTPSPGGFSESILTVSATSNVTSGVYTVEIIGLSDTGTHSTNATLLVPDWGKMQRLAELRRELYKAYRTMAFNQSWWHEVAMDYAKSVEDLWNPLNWTAWQLFQSLLPDVYGPLLIFKDAYDIAEGLVNFYEAIFHDAVYMILWRAHQSTDWAVREDLGYLIETVDLAISASQTHNTTTLIQALEQERAKIEKLYEDTVQFDNEVYFATQDYMIGEIITDLIAQKAYRLLRNHVIFLRLSLVANYVDITTLLGHQDRLSEEIEAPLTSRFSLPMILEGYWEVDDEKVTTARVGQKVEAHIIVTPKYDTPYNPMKVHGKITLKIMKDVIWWLDREHNSSILEIDVSAGETKDLELSFVPDEASNWWPGSIRGYYVKAWFEGKGVFFGTLEVWISWQDGDHEMPNTYPPRLHVEGEVMNVVAESPLNLLVMDPRGRRTGFDPVSQQVFNEISGTSYSGLGTEPQVIAITNPISGSYSIKLIGTSTGSYSLIVELRTETDTQTQTFTGETVEGAVYIYSVSITEEVMTTSPEPIGELGYLSDFINGLPDDSFDKPKLASQKKKGLFNKIDEVILKVEAGNYTDAINKLCYDIRAKMDGDSTAGDWIVDPEMQVSLCIIIDHIIFNIETLEQA